MPTFSGPKGRLGKFGNRISYDQSGNRFDSKKELKRWEELNLLLRAGDIKKLERQKAYELKVNGVKVCTYKADFVYYESFKSQFPHLQEYAWREVVEDVKGVRTAVYLLKKKLMKACLGIEIRES